MNLIFASNNKGKIIEVQSMIPDDIKVVSMKDAGIEVEIPEPFDTFRDNAKAKAIYIKNITGQNCFAEDSGLIVPALDGKPGVFSARYAGEPSNDQNNNQKLLRELNKVADKSAYYQSVICLLLDEEIHYFEGKCEGSITETPKGDGGFGYDPLFVPEGYQQTFGELPLEIKNTLSHRGKAMKLFTEFLHKYIAEEKRHIL
jgi:XTP/dITP diphosphohydrolase